MENVNPSEIFKFDPITRIGFVTLMHAATKADIDVKALKNELMNVESKLHNWVIRFCKCSNEDLIRTVISNYVTGKMMQAILQYRSHFSEVAFANNAEWSGLTADVTIANILGYFNYSQLPSDKKLDALIGGQKHTYHPAFYKEKLQKVWRYFFGRDLLAMVADEDTGERYMRLGDGQPLYKLLVQGLGIRFCHHYETVLNPKRLDKNENETKWRMYTYTQVMKKSPLLDRALDKYTDLISLKGYEIAVDKELVYLDRSSMSEKRKKAIRHNARNCKGGLYDRVSSMATIEDLVEYFDEEDRKRGKQHFLYLPSAN